MLTEKNTDVVILSYGDPLALGLLWQKALLMVPLWAIPLVPFIGLMARYLGTTGLEIIYGLLMCLFIVYLLEDSLKRKIRIDDRKIFFGFRSYPISEIVSLESPNRKHKLLPACLAITTNTGKELKFKLDGLSDNGLEKMISHLQSRNSAIKVSPVLNVLLKAHRAPQLPVVIPEKFVIAYHDRPIVGESVAIFRSTAAKWMRLGPILTCLVAAPVWLGLLSFLFFILQPHDYGDFSQLHDFFGKLSSAFSTSIGGVFVVIGESVVMASKNSFAMTAIGICFASMFLYLQHLLWKPNQLIADNRGLRLHLKVGAISLPFKFVKWQDMQSLKLEDSANGAAKLHIEKSNGKAVSFSLSAIDDSKRSSLLKRIELLAPKCPIEHEAVQCLLPQSDHSYTELWLQSLTQAPQRQAVEPLEPGQLLASDYYEVLHQLGVGGQGTAYLCRDLNSGSDSRNIVLKETILPIFVDPIVRRKALESFEREAKLLQSLVHPGIVQLVHYFVEDHRAYLVLEHLPGSNLRELINKEGPVTEGRLHHLAIQMCEILLFLHKQSVVHRDFSPDNLILDSQDKLKLIDFNVAQQSQGGSQGAIVGKPAYMPPEQFRGKATAQSDIYAFGATLFFLLTGFDPEPIMQSSVSEHNKSASALIDNIIKRATAPQLSNRYMTAEEIIIDLNACASMLDSSDDFINSEVSAIG